MLQFLGGADDYLAPQSRGAGQGVDVEGAISDPASDGASGRIAVDVEPVVGVGEETAAMKKAGLTAADNHRAEGTGENEWYTPPRYVEAARQAMGGIDLDPATSIPAQHTVQAGRFFTRADDGLAREWNGRVWLNPPYAQPLIHQFVTKLVEELTEGRAEAAILLTHNYTDTAWFHLAESVASAICFTRGRVKFLDADGGKCAPTQGQAFFYYGGDRDAFGAAFAQFGFIR